MNKEKQTATLKFSSFADLVDFQYTIGLQVLKIDTDALTLTAELEESAIELAQNGFNASLIKQRVQW